MKTTGDAPMQQNHPGWASPRWSQALTLTERLALLPAEGAKPPMSVAGQEEDTASAARQVQRWKAQEPFRSSALFADRLALEGITEQELLAVLAHSSEAVQTRLADGAPPAWVRELVSAFAEPPASGDASLALLAALDRPGRMALLRPFQPILSRALRRLQAGIDALCNQSAAPPFDPHTVVALLVSYLAQTLLPKVARTLVLELHVARLQERLGGETAEERFQRFVQRLGEPVTMLALLEEYPVLARQVVIALDLWVTASLELLTHLCADWPQLCARFTPERQPGLLADVRCGAGDLHRGGRSVTVLTFASGFRLVYKPRSLAIDQHFQEVLDWLNQRGQLPTFRTLHLLDRGTHGWSEFISASSCTSVQEVERFYERQGSYLAVLYALGARDVHAENIIAAGEHPLLIDLEALFHPRLKREYAPRAEQPPEQALDRSVVDVGLLPERVWSTQAAVGVDISGLGRQPGQRTPRPVPQWEDEGTDQMHLVRERVELAVAQNRPRLNGQEVPTAEYRDQVVRGFTSTYRLLLAQRQELLAEQLPRFASDTIRFIARPTRIYTLLLWESFHPNLLRDALKRDRFFDRLWLGVQWEPALARLIRAEQADLLQGDIPLFTTRPESRNLWSSRGERIAAYFEEAGLEEATKRVQQLDENDLARHVEVIQVSFLSLGTGSD